MKLLHHDLNLRSSWLLNVCVPDRNLTRKGGVDSTLSLLSTGQFRWLDAQIDCDNNAQSRNQSLSTIFNRLACKLADFLRNRSESLSCAISVVGRMRLGFASNPPADADECSETKKVGCCAYTYHFT